MSSQPQEPAASEHIIRADMLAIDNDRCAGHGRCYDLFPEHFEPDDVGWALLRGTSNTAGWRDIALRAVDECPERAISITTADV